MTKPADRRPMSEFADDRRTCKLKKFFFHIGMHKTASTSCQRAFDAHRPDLARLGLRYLAGPTPNHSFLIMALFGADGEKFDRMRDSGYIKPVYLDTDYLSGLWRAFIDDARTDALLSAEAGSYLAKERIHGLRDEDLRNFNLTALAFVRPPLSFARSAAQQMLKQSHSFAMMMNKPPTPDYRARFEKYIELLGRDRMLLEIFHASRMRGGDPAVTLLAMMGYAAPAGLKAPRFNESMSATAAKLLSILADATADPGRIERVPMPVLRALRALPPKFGFGELERGSLRGAMMPRRLLRLAQDIPGPPFAMPVEIGDAADEASSEDVAWISDILETDIKVFDSGSPRAGPSLADAETLGTDEIRVARDWLSKPRHIRPRGPRQRPSDF